MATPYCTISIHGVLADPDGKKGGALPQRRNFNPRGPRGPRLALVKRYEPTPLFQSTGSSRTPTLHFSHMTLTSLFQSTGSSRTPTSAAWPSSQRSPHFNPRGPRGLRRPASPSPVPSPSHFNPQGPRGPRQIPNPVTLAPYNFNPRGPRGPRQIRGTNSAPC